jgi:hypothetical protein
VLWREDWAAAIDVELGVGEGDVEGDEDSGLGLLGEPGVGVLGVEEGEAKGGADGLLREGGAGRLVGGAAVVGDIEVA